jgi:energy-coupling factor transport system permease protein
MTYVRRASPLHAARAAVAAAYCLALATVAFVCESPLVLGTLIVTTLAAGAAARVLPELARIARYGLVLGLLIALINPFVVSDGLTVIARGWLVGDITLEATVYGLVLGLRAVAIVLACGLGALCVDPDEVLALLRRRSLRSALTAALATRLVPVLARDGRRLADAQRARPGEGASRLALVRAVAAGALDRAVDVAATLEVRGYGAARHAPRGPAAPWSRHDLAFVVAAAAIALGVIGARLAGVAAFEAYPALDAPAGAAELVLCAALAVVALLPFADRRGIER